MGVDVEMYVRVKPPLSEPRVTALAGEICEAFGAKHFVADGPGPLEVVEPGDSVYGSLSETAGVRIEREPDEQIICVHLISRYYGEGYERGDLLLIVSVIEWLEQRIPSAEVWYGGDCESLPPMPWRESGLIIQRELTPQERRDFSLTRPRTNKERKLAQAVAKNAVMHLQAQRDLAKYLGEAKVEERLEGELSVAVDVLTDLSMYIMGTPLPVLPPEGELTPTQEVSREVNPV